MNHETATDFELNKRLAELMAWRYESGIKSVEYDEQQKCFWVENVGFQSFGIENYCTNWSDIMPIVVELKIKLDPRRSLPKLGWMASLDDQNYTVGKSPQRALVICCIKVLESKGK